VIKFYLFDKNLRLHLTDALERIEIAVRAQLIDVLGEIGSFSYRDPRTYTASFTEKADGKPPLITPFIEGLDKAFLFSKEEFAKHFRDKYEGHPPVWIAAGTWDWGNLSYMLGYLSEKNRDAICHAIDPRLTRNSLASWMKCLNEVRNACAHHSRLWNKPLINSPRLKPSEINEFSQLINERGTVPDACSKRLYGALVIMIFLMRTF
jgi:abortive infection bacteriophage resistance protein